jgi:histidinol-phosphate aminotransferase
MSFMLDFPLLLPKTKDNTVSLRPLVPEYIQRLKVYQAGKPIDELAREKKLTRISKLASNENPLGPSPKALEAIRENLSELHRYPDMNAYATKTALAEKYQLKRENIILGNGSEGIMAYICRAFLQPGDEILTSDKTFIGFYILARASGCNLVTTPMTEDYRFDVKAMAQKITDNTRVIYIANPNNPTGTYINKSEFDFLMEKVPAHCIVILDEAYFEYAVLKEDYPDSMNYRYDNVITLRTLSKAYGIAGVRMGYGFAHENFIENLHKVKLPFEPNLLAQKAAVAALKDEEHLKNTVELNSELMEKTVQYLKSKGLKPIPSVTNFVTFKTGSGEASDWMFQELLNQGVIIRPLKANEMNDFIRVSIGTRDEMDHYFEAMDNILPKFMDKFGAQL